MLAARSGAVYKQSGLAGHRPICARTSIRPPPRSQQQVTLVTRAQNRDGFVTGFVLGGVVFGALGFIFAPQISKAFAEDQRLKLPNFGEEESKDPAQQDLIEKVARLNASIDEVAAKFKTAEPEARFISEANNLTSDLKRLLQL